MSEINKVLESLEPLIKEAERSGKWLRSTYQGINFSPSELRKENARGRFRWVPSNWTLFNPNDLIKIPEEAAKSVEKKNSEIRSRMGKS